VIIMKNKIDKNLLWESRRARFKNKIKDHIWNLTKLVRKSVLIITGIGGVQVMEGSLAFRVKRNGIWYDYGTVGHKVITTAMAEFVVDQLIAETSVFGDFKYHEIGTGTTAENITDTDIETGIESRATGTQVEDSSKVYKSIASISITGTHAITEHCIFNDASAGTLMDRTVFTAVNLKSGDTFAATYKLTVSDNT